MVVARRVAALAAAALLVVACGSDGEPTAATTTTTTTGGPAPPGAAQDPVVAQPGPGPGAAPGTTATDPVGEPQPTGPEPPPVGETPTSTLPPPGQVGAAAAWYLRPDGAPTILVEVRSQDGAGPRSVAVERVRAVLAELTGKPVAVRAGTVPGDRSEWTAAELGAVADGGAAPSSSQAVLRLLFLRGGFAENERAVGVAVRSDVAAVFADRVDEAAGVFGDPAVVEDAVAMHEVGHLLGLVDLVLDTGRADPEHPGHSPNRASVMYYAVESTLLGTVLSGGPPRDFDADDLADLAAIRDE